MGARSYIPQLGRFLQADPMPGGSSNPYAYTDGDPVNQTDLTGAYVENDYVLGLGMEQNIRAIELEAAREAAIRKEAEERAREAAIQAKFAAQAAAELAEAEARNLWNAEAAAGPPGSIAGGGEVPEVIGQSAQPAGGGGATATASCFKNSAYYGRKDECCSGFLYPYKVVKKKPAGKADGKVNIGASIGACAVGAVVVGTAAAFSSVGLATEAGAYAGCFVAGGVVTIFEEV